MRSVEAGEASLERRRIWALRMRVMRSPTGSFRFISVPSPARLDHARDLTVGGQFAERDARELELAIEAARTARQLAAIADARGRRVARQLRELEARCVTLFQRQIFVERSRFQLDAAVSELLRQAL